MLPAVPTCPHTPRLTWCYTRHPQRQPHHKHMHLLHPSPRNELSPCQIWLFPTSALACPSTSPPHIFHCVTDELLWSICETLSSTGLATGQCPNRCELAIMCLRPRHLQSLQPQNVASINPPPRPPLASSLHPLLLPILNKHYNPISFAKPWRLSRKDASKDKHLFS